jgi:hypothetical protein
MLRTLDALDQAIKIMQQAEQALGENLVWLSDALDQRVRQKDPETLRRLKQLNDAWVALAKIVAK